MSDLSGKLIIFEGPDGVGKTTISQQVNAHLAGQGLPCQWLSFPGREVGSLGQLIYKVHHQPEYYEVHSMTAAAKQTLHIAAHLDAIEQRIIPLLAQGVHVIMDRYWWSTWVYGITSGLNPALLTALIEAERVCWDSVTPSTVFLVESIAPRNREDEDLTNWYSLKQAYRELAKREQSGQVIWTLLNTGTLAEAMYQVDKVLSRILP